ncbi:MAG: hypothetical protein ACREH8_22880 [Opitutaceae bacterium]
MSTLETIVEELKTLPPPKLEEAATLIRRLHEDVRTERLAALERSAGLGARTYEEFLRENPEERAAMDVWEAAPLSDDVEPHRP